MTTHSASAPVTKAERFRRAISGEPSDRPPVWLMRQAGRYMPEYHTIRNKYDFMGLCRTPDAAAAVSLQPLDILDVDGVIVFNDIVTPMETMGTPVVFTDHGPSLEQPIRAEADLERFKPATFDHDEAVFQTLSILREKIGPDVALLGFAGCPFTLACYAIEGKLSKNLTTIKEMKNRQTDLFNKILENLTHTVIEYLKLQIEAGVNLVQIFDSWAGALSYNDYRDFAHRWQVKVIEGVRETGVPVTLYVGGSTPVLDLMAQSGADVLSVDWRLPLSEVRKRIGPDITLQGNLDPVDLYDDSENVAKKTAAMLDDIGDDPRYIANLGHGILPKTPVESVKTFIQTVKGRSR